MTRRRALPILYGLLLALVVASPAVAHADLVSADPPDKSVLATPPRTITLTFSKALDAKSRFDLIGPGGTVGTGAPGTDPATLVLDGLALAPGDYEIRWTSVATDGDILRGTLSFSVTQPTPPAGPSAVAAASQAPTAGPSDASTAAPTASPVAVPAEPASGSSGDVVLPIVAAAVIVAGVGLVLLRRSRRA